jgi:hypothetical protein
MNIATEYKALNSLPAGYRLLNIGEITMQGDIVYLEYGRRKGWTPIPSGQCVGVRVRKRGFIARICAVRSYPKPRTKLEAWRALLDSFATK